MESAPETFPHNPPCSKEAYYFRQVFEKHYPGRAAWLPHYWTPCWMSDIDVQHRNVTAFNKISQWGMVIGPPQCHSWHKPLDDTWIKNPTYNGFKELSAVLPIMMCFKSSIKPRGAAIYDTPWEFIPAKIDGALWDDVVSSRHIQEKYLYSVTTGLAVQLTILE